MGGWLYEILVQQKKHIRYSRDRCYTWSLYHYLGYELGVSQISVRCGGGDGETRDFVSTRPYPFEPYIDMYLIGLCHTLSGSQNIIVHMTYVCAPSIYYICSVVHSLTYYRLSI